MNLPINEKELNTIISAMRLGGDTALYQKLWSYKINLSRVLLKGSSPKNFKFTEESLDFY